jgi:hypothetical protein
LLFSEDEYREDVYEEYYYDIYNIISTKLDRLHVNFKPPTPFKLAVDDKDIDNFKEKYIESVNKNRKKKSLLGENIADTVISLMNPDNKFMNITF